MKRLGYYITLACLAARGERERFFVVHGLFACPKGMQKAHALQKSLCQALREGGQELGVILCFGHLLEEGLHCFQAALLAQG